MAGTYSHERGKLRGAENEERRVDFVVFDCTNQENSAGGVRENAENGIYLSCNLGFYYGKLVQRPPHHRTACHSAPLRAEWLILALRYAPDKIGHTFSVCMCVRRCAAEILTGASNALNLIRQL